MLRLTQDSVRRTGAVRLLRIVSIPKLMNTETQQTVLVTGSAGVVHQAATMADEPESDDINIHGAQRLVAA